MAPKIPTKYTYTPAWMTEMANTDLANLPESMCYLQAIAAKEQKKIDEDAYHHHVLSHLAGTKHEEEEAKLNKLDLERWDPFAYEVFNCAKKIERAQNSTPFEQLFKAYSAGDLEGTKAKVAGIKEPQAPYILRILAMRALVDRQVDFLKFCLDRGFDYDWPFRDKAVLVKENDHPEIFKLLEESNFGKLYPRDNHPWNALDIGGKFPVDW